MTTTPNPQIELAFDYIQYTNKNIFLTGKAGTGKTTFLHRVRKESIKRTVVVAPTGVAAINAKGMTIHSFFQLPFGPFIPGSVRDAKQQRRFAKRKINLIKSLDLLIIDEISMVRADMLDAIDDVLRRYKDYSKPFGGVQLLMIGDLHQLPPVVKPDEWNMLHEHYHTPYFFGSLALQKTDPISIELKHIYRQSDGIFIELLNKVRNNKMDREVLEKLNSRYIPNFQISEEEPYITLTSHNASAQRINEEKLDELVETPHHFMAKISGDFPKHAYPTEEKLTFKKGAQVLFIKNDLSPDKRYYNGKIGQIARIDKEEIFVKCPGDSELIAVKPAEWKNIKYTLLETTKEVEEEIIGTFTQFPLKLAWAITIHKSQGLTFERAIIDAKAAFAHGQVYVALSRCKSFEGIVLRTKIDYSSVKIDNRVKQYSQEASENAPTEADLQQSKKAFQQSMIRELFDFKDVKYGFQSVHRVYLEHENTLGTPALQQFLQVLDIAEKTVFEIADKFKSPLEAYFIQTDLPEKNEALQERLKKAALYFSEKLNNGVYAELKKVPVLADNKSVVKKALDSLEKLEKALFTKNNCFEVTKSGFEILKYIQTKTNSDLDFAAQKRKTAAKSRLKDIPKNVKHPELYAQLMQWRAETAMDRGMTQYEILPSRTIADLAKLLPANGKALLQVKGIGKVKVRQFGADLIAIIQAYCDEKDIAPTLLSAAPKKEKGSSQKMSLELYKSGKSIEEIAEERGFATSTIEGHLAQFIGTGELDIFDFMEAPKVEEIEKYYLKNDTRSTSEARAHFGEKYSYEDLRRVVKYLQFKEQEK